MDLNVRVPRWLAELFTSDAAAAGVSQPDRMEEILRERYEAQARCTAGYHTQGGVVRKSA